MEPEKASREIDVWKRFGDSLRKCGYEFSTVGSLLRHSDRLNEKNRKNISRMLSPDEPAAMLVKLAILGEAVEEKWVKTALGGDLANDLTNSGFLVRDGTRWNAAAQVRPVGEHTVISDFDFGIDQRTRNFVPSPGKASLTLAAVTPQTSCDSFLDLGTGTGIQALLATPFADRISATDTNPRALGYAAINAALNQVHFDTLGEGKFFAPVAGKSFSRIVSNPPFVISPENRYEYRDGSADEESPIQRLVRETPDSLGPGGQAVFLANWGHEADADWEIPPMRWLEGLPVNGWVIRFDSSDVFSYTETWLASEFDSDYEEVFDRWLRYYEERQFSGISGGILLLEKPAPESKPWRRCDDIRVKSVAGNIGSRLFEMMATETRLQSPAWESDLAGAVLSAHSDTKIHQTLGIGNGTWQLDEIEARGGNAWPFAGKLDNNSWILLNLMDGKRTAGKAISKFASQVGGSDQNLRKPCLDLLVKWLRAGILLWN